MYIDSCNVLAKVESRTQGSRPRPRIQKTSRPRPRTDLLEVKDQEHRRKCSPKKRRFSKKFFRQSQKKGLQIFVSGKKGLQKIFFGRFPLEENKKRSSQIFCKVSGAFQQNFNGSKNSAVLKPRTGQFSRT